MSGRGCELAGDQLHEFLDSPDKVSSAVVSHVGQCLRCQADIARFRRTRRMLRQLIPPISDGELAEALATIEARGSTGPVRAVLVGHRATVAGVAAAVVAGLATTTLVVGRSRNRAV